MNLLNVFALLALLGPKILAILGLITADVILALAVAIATGVFKWAKLADFFRTMVIPKLLGWLAAAVICRFVLPEYLPASLEILGPGIETIMFGMVVLSLGGSILGHYKELKMLPDTRRLNMIK